MKVKYKDPDANLDYDNSWAKYLGTDTIASVQAFVVGTPAEPDLQVTAVTFTDTVVKVWLAQGVVGSSYIVTIRVTTAAGRIDDYSFKVKIKEK